MRCAGCATRRDLPWPLFRRSLWAVGVSSAAFTLFHGMLLQSLPVPEPQQLFRVEIESRRSSRAEHSALNLMTNDAGQRIASSKISALAPSSSAKPRKIQTLRRAPSCDISAVSLVMWHFRYVAQNLSATCLWSSSDPRMPFEVPV